jgi:hypothetical protein
MAAQQTKPIIDAPLLENPGQEQCRTVDCGGGRGEGYLRRDGWSVAECIRDLIQNTVDETTAKQGAIHAHLKSRPLSGVQWKRAEESVHISTFTATIEFEPATFRLAEIRWSRNKIAPGFDQLVLTNYGKALNSKVFDMRYTNKDGQKGMIGKHGDGLKTALGTLQARHDRHIRQHPGGVFAKIPTAVCFDTNGQRWKPMFINTVRRPAPRDPTLHIKRSKVKGTSNTIVRVHHLPQGSFDPTLYLMLTPPPLSAACWMGRILLDNSMQARVFNKGALCSRYHLNVMVM